MTDVKDVRMKFGTRTRGGKLIPLKHCSTIFSVHGLLTTYSSITVISDSHSRGASHVIALSKRSQRSKRHFLNGRSTIYL